MSFSRRTFRALMTLAASSVLLLAGCASTPAPSSLHENHSGFKVDIVRVVGSTFRGTIETAREMSAPRLAEELYERSMQFCRARKGGMMPLTGSSDEHKAWLEFRCSNPEYVEREYQPIQLHFDDSILEDDEKSGRRRSRN